MRRTTVFLLALLAGVITLAGCGTKPNEAQAPQSTPQGAKQMKWDSAPAMAIDQNKTYTAVIKTNHGDITVQLLPKEAPLAVNNFVFLARQGFYDGVIFHRIIKGFMMQGGDPTGTGAGGPGYRFADEPVTRKYTPGTLAMANAGPNTNGSQFFIMLDDYPLPPNYTIFGQTTAGMDVVKKIETFGGNNDSNSRPTVDIHIDTVTIEEK